MSILVNKETRVIVQGITGRDGAFHAKGMRDYGTQVVGGVTPGKAGENVDGIPVFNTVVDAVAATQANATVIYVPALFAANAIYEAVEAGIRMVVCITEGIPVQSMLTVVNYVKPLGVTLIGGNCPGLITPGEAKLGIMPGNIHLPGNIGVISRSGTLTYEVVNSLTQVGLGQSTVIGIGGDPIKGTNFVELIKQFNADPKTEAIVMLGEIGGTDEEEAASYIKANVRKPVYSFIAGLTAPPGKRMGHAGAIISGGKGRAEDKIEALKSAGVHMVERPDIIGAAVKRDH